MPEARERAVRAVARRSPTMLRLFGALFARDMTRSFHAVRLQGGWPSVDGPLVIFANHPSWWDAELFVWLMATTFAHRRCFAPMEAAMIHRYRFFERIGAFPVETGSFAGASTFLATADEVLGRADGMLFVNAEGAFRDARERPVRPMKGLAHIARRTPAVTFVPLAIEVSFWNERRPNLLLRCGEPIGVRALSDLSAAQASECLGDALAATMDALAVASRARDGSRFETLLTGRTGINPFYDLWRRARAVVAGHGFDPAHEP